MKRPGCAAALIAALAALAPACDRGDQRRSAPEARHQGPHRRSGQRARHAAASVVRG